MAHLKKSSTTGHLLYSPTNFHLVKECNILEEYFLNCAIVLDFTGNPQIMYQYDNGSTNGDICAIRATNAAGTTWDDPFVIYSAGFGNPKDENADITCGVFGATATYPDRHWVVARGAKSGNTETKLVYSTNAGNTTWSTNNIRGVESTTLMFSAFLMPNDKIGVATDKVGAGGGVFWNVGNVDGTTWNSYSVPLTGLSFPSTRFVTMIAGRPAMYLGYLSYTRANNADGTSWPSPVKTMTPSATPGEELDMSEVNGLPAFLWIRNAGDDLDFYIGNNADGTSWPSASSQVNDSGAGAEGNGSKVTTAQLTYVDDSNPTTYAHWAGKNVIEILDSSLTVIGYRRCVYESTSTDDGTTWSTPTIKWSVDMGTTGNEYNVSYYFDHLHVVYDADAAEFHALWTYTRTDGSTLAELYYDGNLVMTRP